MRVGGWVEQVGIRVTHLSTGLKVEACLPVSDYLQLVLTCSGTCPDGWVAAWQ